MRDLTLLFSFVPGDASLFHLSRDAQHHGHCQQISHLDNKALLKQEKNITVMPV